jgi:hypothetical protein
MAVGTKLTIVPLIIQRVDSRLKDIGKVLQADPSKVEACLRSRAVYRLPDCDAAYEAAVDFDSFIFESRSAYEITVSFLERFFNLILGKALGPRSGKHAAKHVEEALRARGSRTEWVNDLRKKRNLLIHARSLWLAFEVRDGQPFRFDPVLLTKSVERIEDDPERLSIAQCRSFWQGFVSSYEHIEAWLKDELANTDACTR